MAGYNSIKILRGNSKNLSGNLMSGQPLYIRDKNYLTVGSSDGDVINKAPITVRELVGWSSDNGGIISTNSNGYYIRSNSTSNGLDIFASQPINISAPTDINIIAFSPSEATTLSDLQLSSSGNTDFISNGSTNIIANSYVNISSGTQPINISSDTDLMLTSRTSDVNISAHTNLNASAISLNARANHIALTIGSYPSIYSFANSITLNVGQGAGITLGPQSVVISNANVAFGTILDVDGGVVRAGNVTVTSAHLTVSPTQLTIDPTGPINISAGGLYYNGSHVITQEALPYLNEVDVTYYNRNDSNYNVWSASYLHIRYTFADTAAVSINTLGEFRELMISHGYTEDGVNYTYLPCEGFTYGQSAVNGSIPCISSFYSSITATIDESALEFGYNFRVRTWFANGQRSGWREKLSLDDSQCIVRCRALLMSNNVTVG